MPSQTRLLPVPYPYCSALAICSDLDETPSSDAYFEILEFLNTDRQTGYGRGVNLEVGNSIYFDMPEEQFSWWNCTDSDRARLKKLIHSGHIDCIHSFGDLAVTRARAMECLAELVSSACRMDVWIDHAQAPSNFDPGIMKGQGATPGAVCYHADETIGKYGISFVWKGRVTSIIGQNCRRSHRGLFSRESKRQSLVTIAKEVAKGILGRFGSAKYRMHAANELLRKTTLEDGQVVFEFMRFNPSRFGVNRQENAPGLGEVLSRKILDRFVKRGGLGVLYTHLGKGGALTEKSQEAMRLLGQYSASKEIVVMTTRRLLGYARTLSEIAIDYSYGEGRRSVEIRCSGDIAIDDMAGLSWVSSAKEARLLLNGLDLTEHLESHDAGSGLSYFTLPWRKLKYPD